MNLRLIVFLIIDYLYCKLSVAVLKKHVARDIKHNYFFHKTSRISSGIFTISVHNGLAVSLIYRCELSSNHYRTSMLASELKVSACWIITEPEREDSLILSLKCLLVTSDCFSWPQLWFRTPLLGHASSNFWRNHSNMICGLLFESREGILSKVTNVFKVCKQKTKSYKRSSFHYVKRRLENAKS